MTHRTGRRSPTSTTLIASGELVDAKSIIGLLLAAPVPRRASMAASGMARRARRPARRVRDVVARRARPRAQLARGVPARPAPLRRLPPTARRHRRRRGRRRGDRRRLRRGAAAGARPTTASRRYTESSIARALAAVRSFHRFCVEEGLLASDPSEDVGAPARAAGDPEGAHRGRGRGAARARCPATARARCATGRSSRLLYAGGLRISELVGLDLGDLDLHDGLVRVLGKGSKERVVPLGRTARDALGDYLTTRPPRARPAAGPAGRRRGVPQRARAAGSPVRARGSSCGPPATAPGSAAACSRTCCATRARPTCSTTAPTSGWSRSCSATPASRPRRCTRRCRRSGCGRSTTPPTPGRGAGAQPGPGPPAGPGSRLRRMADTTHAVLRDQLQEERDRVREQLARLGHGDGADARLRRELRRLGPGHRRARRGRGARRASSARPCTTSRTRWPSSTPAPTASASRATSAIPEARLEAMPAARLCINCASQRR